LKRKTVIRIGLLLLVLAAFTIGFQFRGELSPDALRRSVDDFGAWAPLVFMVTYALATVAFLPGLVFTIAGGVLFGPWLGTLFSLIGATVGATAAFFIARLAASDWVADKAGGRLQQLLLGVEREGWRFVALVRLVPVFPFNLLNYSLGLTRIPPLAYIVTSFICMAPGALAYAWVGHAGAEAIAGGERGIQAVMIALGLLAMVILLPRLVRRIRQQPVVPAGDES